MTAICYTKPNKQDMSRPPLHFPRSTSSSLVEQLHRPLHQLRWQEQLHGQVYQLYAAARQAGVHPLYRPVVLDVQAKRPVVLQPSHVPRGENWDP